MSDDAVVGVRVADVDAEQHGDAVANEGRRSETEKEKSKANWRISKEPGIPPGRRPVVFFLDLATGRLPARWRNRARGMVAACKAIGGNAKTRSALGFFQRHFPR